MKKMKKSLKGMTLMEIIVAMVIFSVTALILVQGAIASYKSTSQTRELVKKINYQAPIADRMPEVSTYDVENIQVQVVGGGSHNFDVKKYEVEPAETGQPAGNFRYFDYQTPSAVTTTH